MDGHPDFVNFDETMADELVRMWRDSYHRALAPHRTPHSFAEHRHFLLTDQARRAKLTVALLDERIAGFMAQAGETIDQLYLHVDCQDRGLGSRFIERAKAASPARLHLFTFQRNLKARRFYRKHGFSEIAYGWENMEGLADVELEYRGSPHLER